MSENELTKGLCLRILKDGNVVSHRRLDEKTFDLLKRLLELIGSDEEALIVMDKAINMIEAPKREITEKIRDKIIGQRTMPGMLQEALMVLPMVHLREMALRLDELKLRREPGGDCLYIEYGDESRRINL